MQVFMMIDAGTYDDRCKCLRWQMQEPEIANWQNINSQLEKRKQPTSAFVASRLFYWNSYRKLLYFIFV